ncbi:hypothetical protein ACIP93_00745 [Streptomyces sp. NPDC088745]|uniref:hypothetical protein n=1 Tax=Streptomyces sp. NPDC088745 TaxID=3365884 RepID=UPI00380FC23E
MSFAPFIAFAVILLAWGGPIVLLFAERTRFLAPWLLALAVSGTAAAYALGGTEVGNMVGILCGPSVVAVLIYLILRWGFRSSPRTAQSRRTTRFRGDT